MKQIRDARREFLEKISYKPKNEKQDSITRDAINSQLFKVLDSFELENGEIVSIRGITALVATNLGVKEKLIKSAIRIYIEKLLQSGKYQYDLDLNGNIRANYSRMYMLQKEGR